MGFSKKLLFISYYLKTPSPLTGFFSKEMKSGLNFFKATSSSWYISGLFLYKARSTLACSSLYGLQIPKDKIKPVSHIVLTCQLHKTLGFLHAIPLAAAILSEPAKRACLVTRAYLNLLGH